MADIGVVTETDVEHIVKHCLARLIKLDVVKTVDATFEDALLSGYFDSRNGLKMAMFSVVENTLAEIFGSGQGHTVTKW